ncbi:hypothetical protein M0R04_16435 [Candidatus Dojkabacteria bacterium]|jgi:hypothetical protein|nr:hypothetical protein [Candidatus Dojkabacteria bacterium]
MNFISYINEVKNSDEILTNCSEYIKDISYCSSKLYRGTRYNIRTWKKLSTREDRRPRDTKQYVHDKFDEKFAKKFGWKARSESVMVISNKGYAGAYTEDTPGNTCIFLPINGFKYIWSPKISDFFVVVKDLWPWEGNHNQILPLGSRIATINKDVLDMFKLNMITLLKEIDKKECIKDLDKTSNTDEISDMVADAIVSTYTKKHLCDAINKEVEIMFKCDAYYLVNPLWSSAIGLGI